MQARLEKMPDAARTAGRPPSTFRYAKSWMGATHFLMKRLPNVRNQMSLHVLAYNMKRAMQILGGTAGPRDQGVTDLCHDTYDRLNSGLRRRTSGVPPA
jgi:hypothetical protein